MSAWRIEAALLGQSGWISCATQKRGVILLSLLIAEPAHGLTVGLRDAEPTSEPTSGRASRSLAHSYNYTYNYYNYDNAPPPRSISTSIAPPADLQLAYRENLGANFTDGIGWEAFDLDVERMGGVGAPVARGDRFAGAASSPATESWARCWSSRRRRWVSLAGFFGGA